MNTNKDIGLLIIRLTVGILFFFHGAAKMHDLSGTAGAFKSVGLPGFFAYAAYLGELIAPIMLIIGYRARIAAALIAFTMLIAILVAHTEDFFKLSPHGGWALELQALYLLGAVSVFFTGAGTYGISKTNNWD